MEESVSHEYPNNKHREVRQWQEEQNSRCEFKRFFLPYECFPVVFWNLVSSDLFFVTASLVVKHDLTKSNDSCTEAPDNVAIS